MGAFMKLLTSFLLLTPLLFAEVSIDDLSKMSIEELLDVRITSVTKQEEDSFRSTAAVFVISSEEIRRSGATNLPELLEMVPGFNVGQLAGNMFAINARGENTRNARQLLVMVDGRNVHSPTVGNVHWDQLDFIMEDIERVEIIRGPGSALWGTNASNGIVNVITKHTSETKGALVYAQGASEHLQYDVAARYGFGGENYSGRLYAKRKKNKRSIYPELDEQSRPGRTRPYAESYDGRRLTQAGYRHDVDFSNTSSLMVNVQVEKVDTEEAQTTSNPAKEVVYNYEQIYLLSVLDIDHSIDSHSKLQFSVERSTRDTDFIDDTKNLYDIDFQNSFKTGDLKTIWGLGYNLLDHSYTNSNTRVANLMDPEEDKLNTYTGFAQFTYALFDDKLELTAGSKYVNDHYTGDEVMPTFRLGFYPNESNTFWLSATRTVTTPSRQSNDGYLRFGSTPDPICGFLGGFVDSSGACIVGKIDGLDSSHINVYEAGYRTKFLKVLVDQSVYYNDYKDHNLDTDKLDYVYGYEAVVKYLVDEDLRFDATYAYSRGKDFVDGSTFINSRSDHPSHGIPKHTITLKSSYNITSQAEMDIFYRFRSKLKENETIDELDALNQLNIRLGYHFDSGVETSVLVSNILDTNHIESNPDRARANSYVRRSILGKVTYRF